MKKTIYLLAIVALAACSKPSTTTTPTNTTVNTTTTVVQNLKWQKANFYVQYEADGVTEKYRTENKYDSEGRITETKTVINGQLSSVGRDYTYVGDEATYYQDVYISGVLNSTTKCKTGYYNK